MVHFTIEQVEETITNYNINKDGYKTYTKLQQYKNYTMKHYVCNKLFK